MVIDEIPATRQTTQPIQPFVQSHSHIKSAASCIDGQQLAIVTCHTQCAPPNLHPHWERGRSHLLRKHGAILRLWFYCHLWRTVPAYLALRACTITPCRVNTVTDKECLGHYHCHAEHKQKDYHCIPFHIANLSQKNQITKELYEKVNPKPKMRKQNVSYGYFLYVILQLNSGKPH